MRHLRRRYRPRLGDGTEAWRAGSAPLLTDAVEQNAASPNMPIVNAWPRCGAGEQLLLASGFVADVHNAGAKVDLLSSTLDGRLRMRHCRAGRTAPRCLQP